MTIVKNNAIQQAYQNAAFDVIDNGLTLTASAKKHKVSSAKLSKIICLEYDMVDLASALSGGDANPYTHAQSLYDKGYRPLPRRPNRSKTVDAAIASVRQGMSVYAAAKKYKIDYSNLRRAIESRANTEENLRNDPRYKFAMEIADNAKSPKS